MTGRGSLVPDSYDSGPKKVGAVSIRTAVGDASLEWSVATGAGRAEHFAVDRGAKRLEVEMPVHARPKIVVVAIGLFSATFLVMVGLLSLAARETPVSVGAYVFTLLAVGAVTLAVTVLMGRSRETMILCSRLLTVSDSPYEFAVRRRAVGRFVEYLPLRGGRPRSLWSSPRIALRPSAGTTATDLPLGGGGLSDPETEAVLEAANGFLSMVEAEVEFDEGPLADFPGLATLTDNPHLR